MYKKLMFLISFVCLLGLSSPVLAADLEIPYGETYTVSGTEEYGDMECRGTIVIPTDATLILNDESDVDGGGPDGVGGVVLVDGGTFIINERINFGCDNDAYLIVDNGGSVIHTNEKICIPDNDGGIHRLIVINGTVVAEGIEVDDGDDRDAGVQIACSPTPGVIIAKITTGNTNEDDKWDPDYWATRDINEGGLYDYPKGACASSVLVINDLGGNVKEVYYFAIPLEAWGPTPEDGAVEQVVDVDLEWNAGSGAILKHVVYFGSSYAAVDAAGLADPECRGTGEVGGTATDFDLDVDPPLMIPAKPAVHLELWKTYYWRVDTWRPAITKGNVWSFTTGCALDPGDINLDCLVNFLDYAMLADDWRDKSMFPTDVAP